MLFSKKTSVSNYKSPIGLLIKIALVLIIIFAVVIMLDKIDFPSPNKEIEKLISNEKLKIVK